MPRVTYFDMGVDDAERAMRFYKKVFGWEFTKWDGPFDYWLVMTGRSGEPGIDGGMARRGDPDTHITNFIAVASVDDAVARIRANGGAILQPRQSIPGVGYIAIFQDTEKNMLGILQADANAGNS